MSLTTRLGLVKPIEGTNVVDGNTAGVPNESLNLDAIDAAIATLQDRVPSVASDYLASGAIAQKSGLVTLSKAGVAAMTLADPATPADDGKTLRIVSTTAQAHTVTTIAGISGGANHKATFGGAIGDMLNFIAVQGKWYLLPSINQTLSAS
jgi:hypothetical protein